MIQGYKSKLAKAAAGTSAAWRKKKYTALLDLIFSESRMCSVDELMPRSWRYGEKIWLDEFQKRGSSMIKIVLVIFRFKGARLYILNTCLCGSDKN